MKLLLSYSVVIPTYNSSGKIKNTLKSINNQNEKPDKVFLVDDCSVDIEKLQFISDMQEFKFLNIEIIKKELKSNAAESRNLGWIKSNSDIVFFLDSDDCWGKEHVSKSLIIYKNNDAVECVFTGFVEVNGDKLKYSSLVYNDKTPSDVYIFNKKGDFRSSTVSVRNSLKNKVMFDNKANKHQDWDLFFNFNLNNINIIQIKDYTVNIFVSDQSRMSAKNNVMASLYFVNKWKEKLSVNSNDKIIKKMLAISVFNLNIDEVRQIATEFKKNNISFKLRILLSFCYYNPRVSSRIIMFFLKSNR